MDHAPAPEYLQALAEFACQARIADVSPRALERTRWVILDCLPVIAAGMQTDGEPGNPVREAELRRKFFELGVPIWGEPLAQRVYGTFSDLESVHDMRAVADEFPL